MKKRHQQKLIILSLFEVLLLNIPLVFIFNSNAGIGGFPLLYFYIFVVWSAVIAITYTVLNRRDA